MWRVSSWWIFESPSTKPGSRLVVGEVVGDEFEGREAKGGLEDLVVEGYEADLGGQVVGHFDELLVRFDERNVKEVAERV